MVFKIKWFYSVKTQQQHTIISTLVWLHVLFLSRPSSGQYFPAEGTFGVHYTVWDLILFTGCVYKNNYKSFFKFKTLLNRI